MTLKYMPQIASVPLSLIDVPKERRRLKKATVAEIADSVRVVGLLQPIGLRPHRRPLPSRLRPASARSLLHARPG